jgi:hypothetical protein
MTDLRPILEERSSPAAVRLLRSARLDVPPRGGKARLVAALGLGSATAAAAGAGGASAASVGAVSKWVVLGMLAGVVTTGSVEVVRGRTEARDVVVRAAPARPSPVRVEPPWQNRPATTDAPRTREGGDAHGGSGTGATARTAPFAAPAWAASQDVTAAPTRAPRTLGTAVPPEKAAAPPGLAREIEALDDARRRLDARDAAGALAALDAFEAAFPGARLAPEASVLRLETLLRLGRKDAARRLGERLLGAEPSSTHARRVRSLLAEVERR